MMDISELYDSIFENNVDLHLAGRIELLDCDEIKWSYDALGDDYDDVGGHLATIYEDDLDTIQDFLNEKNIIDNFSILPFELDDTLIWFSIVEE
jgi:hypothetical protein